MKLKHILIPYAVIIVVIPAMIAHLAGPLHLNTGLWNTVMDILMALTAAAGLALTWIHKKSKFRGWIPLLLLLILVILPQLYLWKSQNRGFTELRTIYRYALIYITLFIIPMETHLSRKNICVLIGCFCVFVLISCGYVIIKNPRVWEQMRFFSGKGDGITSWFQQKNRFGVYNALALILCLLAVQLSDKKYCLVPAGVFAVFLVLSESRASIILVLITTFIWLVSYRKHIGTKTFFMILIDIVIVMAVLVIIPPTRNFLKSLIGMDRGAGRETMWQVAWEYYLEGNPLLGHGLGTQIERIMIERANLNYSAHNMYIYTLINGGIIMIVFYILSFVILFRNAKYRHHYLIPLMIGWAVYGFFELASTPFDYWHISNMWTICLFFIPTALSGSRHKHTKRFRN